MTGEVRLPAVAGSFYPADPDALRSMVDGYLADIGESGGGRRPAALIVPHAGYLYSGAVAAAAYAQLRYWRTAIRTVLLIGPSHFVAMSTPALPTADRLRTPLGDIPVETSPLIELGLASRQQRPHAREHSLEVQLPFLQQVLTPGWAAVPVLLGPATPAALVADCLDAVSGDDVLVVVSSDLSHYFDQATAHRLDERTADAIVRRDAAGVADRDACGAAAIRGALVWAVRHRLSVSLLALRTSADANGDTDRVVGYGAFALSDE